MDFEIDIITQKVTWPNKEKEPSGTFLFKIKAEQKDFFAFVVVYQENYFYRDELTSLKIKNEVWLELNRLWDVILSTDKVNFVRNNIRNHDQQLCKSFVFLSDLKNLGQIEVPVSFV